MISYTLWTISIIGLIVGIVIFFIGCKNTIEGDEFASITGLFGSYFSGIFLICLPILLISWLLSSTYSLIIGLLTTFIYIQILIISPMIIGRIKSMTHAWFYQGIQTSDANIEDVARYFNSWEIIVWLIRIIVTLIFTILAVRFLLKPREAIIGVIIGILPVIFVFILRWVERNISHPRMIQAMNENIIQENKRIIIGECENCHRPLRVRKRGIVGKMNLTCKCGHVNNIRVDKKYLK